MWEVVCADVLEWCKNYTGPKFHALLADPPYGLEFMGKEWDRFQGYTTDIDFKGFTLPRQRRRNIKCPDCDKYIYDHDGRACTCGGVKRAQMRAYEQFCYDWVRAIIPHLLPGAFLFIFASSRGWHRLACAMEDAGLIIQPSIFGWLNGQAFPKATRIDTAIDKAAGKLEEREIIGQRMTGGMGAGSPDAPLPPSIITGNSNRQFKSGMMEIDITLPATDLARAWEGHRYGGQILKNALEPIIVAQKPWEGKRLDCIVRTGAGALNVDGGRITHNEPQGRPSNGLHGRSGGIMGKTVMRHRDTTAANIQGRWPANFVLCHAEGCERVGVKRVKGDKRDGSIREIAKNGSPLARSWKNTSTAGIAIQGHADPDGYERVDDWRCVEGCPVARLDEQAGERKSGALTRSETARAEAGKHGIYGRFNGKPDGTYFPASEGGASRFFFQADWSHEIAERIAWADPVRYCPKAARTERNQGLDDFYWRKDKKAPIGFVRIDREEWETLGEEEERIKKETGKRVSLRAKGNIHSTIKPISLCKHLATLLLPPEEYAPRRIFVPFAGSGSEMIAAGLAGWEEIVGIDSKQNYCDIAKARLAHWLNRPKQLELP